MNYPDISHYNPVTNWETVKKNCPFLISKATQGIRTIDPTLTSFIKGCEQYKIPYWLYCYLDKGSELAQVKFMVSTCKSKTSSYFIGYILDIESGNRASDVKAALDYLTDLGNKTMVYTMYADYSQYAGMLKARPSTCAWWEARFGRNDGSYNSQYPCHSGVDLHQYTDQGSCPGISGKADLNRLTGTKPESWFTAASLNESEDDVIMYATIRDVPEWGKSAVQNLLDKGYLSGTGAEKDGQKVVNLTESMLRMIVINTIAGLYQ